MAISGSFKDVKFNEVLRIVARRTGRLWIYNFSSNLFSEWFIHENRIHAVRLNKASLTNRETVLQAAATLSDDAASSYIFYNLTSDRIPAEVSIPVADIGVHTVTSAPDEEIADELLPNPETRFEISPRAAADAVPAELKAFWDVCNFNSPAQFSAGDIALAADLPLKTARTNFYKLRSLKLIRPARALFNHTNSGSNGAPAESPAVFNEPAAPPQRKSLIQRMLDALPSKLKS